MSDLSSQFRKATNGAELASTEFEFHRFAFLSFLLVPAARDVRLTAGLASVCLWITSVDGRCPAGSFALLCPGARALCTRCGVSWLRFAIPLSSASFILLAVGTDQSHAVQALDALNVLPFLDPVLVSDREGIEKPAAEIYLRACARAQVHPAETIHVGDELQA